MYRIVHNTDPRFGGWQWEVADIKPVDEEEPEGAVVSTSLGKFNQLQMARIFLEALKAPKGVWVN